MKQMDLLKDALFRLGYCIQKKNPNMGSRRGLEDVFVNKTLEYLGLSLYLWKFQRKKEFILENSAKLW